MPYVKTMMNPHVENINRRDTSQQRRANGEMNQKQDVDDEKRN